MYVSAKEPYCIVLLNCCIWIPTDALPIWGTCGYDEDEEASHPSAGNPWIKAWCQQTHAFILLK